MKQKVTILIGLNIIFGMVQVWAYVAMDIHKWEIDQKEVVKSYIHKLPYKTYSLSQLQGYNNKLLNYILAIEENYKNKVFIVRVSSDITRDYMFIDNKLYVITDYMQKCSEGYISGAIAQLEKKYGMAQRQNEGSIKTYTFTKDETKVIAIAETKEKNSYLTIYYYYKNIFRSLMQ